MHVLLVEDHQLFASAMQISLASYFECFEISDQKTDFLQLVATKQPDIVLLDIHLGEKNGIEEGKKLLQANPDLKIIFLSGYDLPAYHNAAIQMGARGFIHKNAEIDELVDKIQRVAKGEIIFPKYQKPAETLTEREQAILQLLANGLTQNEMAATLSLSRRTVNNHLQSIFQKFGVHSSLAAIVRGIQQGFVQVSQKDQ